MIPLGGDGYGVGMMPSIRAVSPSGHVPVLHVGDLRIWDSLAICEWAAEQRPEAGLWPKDPAIRAVCRSVVSEMHSGFAALRRDLPMNIRRRTSAKAWPEDTQRDIARVKELWKTLRAERARLLARLFRDGT